MLKLIELCKGKRWLLNKKAHDCLTSNTCICYWRLTTFTKMIYITLCLNIYEVVSSQDSDTDCYIIIRNLLDSIFNIKWEPNLPYQRPHSTQDSFTRLPTQCTVYPQSSFRQTIPNTTVNSVFSIIARNVWELYTYPILNMKLCDKICNILCRMVKRRYIFSFLSCSWLRHYATRWKVAVSIPDEVTGFFNWLNPSSCTMALGSTQPLREMGTRNLPGHKGRLARKADNLTAICEPSV
jgi:hypothetical protein